MAQQYVAGGHLDEVCKTLRLMRRQAVSSEVPFKRIRSASAKRWESQVEMIKTIQVFFGKRKHRISIEYG